MILAVAWRNIWRNKTRSLVILVAICLGLASGIFYMAFYFGMVDQRINTAIKTEASHIQIHHKEYLSNPDKKFMIENAGPVGQEIKRVEGVIATSNRIILNTMIQSPETGAGVKISGIDPEDEKQVTNLYSKLIEGTYFEDGKRNPIIIGKKLAEKLRVKLRSKVVITLQDMQGNMTGAAFKVEGIYETSNTAFDETCVFVRRSDLAPIMLMDDHACQEIAVLLEKNDQLQVADETIKSKLPDLDVKTWREIMPEVSLIESSFTLTMFIFIGIILLALLFGIVNTMLMAVLERAKELGMLMAIGMSKVKLFLMILSETVMLSLFGGLCGIVLGWILTLWFGVQGIDLGAWSAAYKSLGYDTLVYTRLSMGISFQIAGMVIATGIIAAIYPAMKALQLNPADALRIDM